MTKAPDLGRAKTRLQDEIGPRAITVCRAMLRRTFIEADGPWRLAVAVAPRAGIRKWRNLWPRSADVSAQCGGDLGARLRFASARYPSGPIVFIGGDAPALRRRHIVAAFRALSTSDAVFGPAEDGGYWLVGLARRRSAPDAFRGVRWSSENALDDTRASLPHTFTVTLLERLRDVDTAADLAAASLMRGGGAA